MHLGIKKGVTDGQDCSPTGADTRKKHVNIRDKRFCKTQPKERKVSEFTVAFT